jgi:hypothetical protein
LCECGSRGSTLASAGAKPAFVSTGGRQEVCATRADAFPGLLRRSSEADHLTDEDDVDAAGRFLRNSGLMLAA